MILRMDWNLTVKTLRIILRTVWFENFKGITMMAQWNQEQLSVMCSRKMVGIARSFLMTQKSLLSYMRCYACDSIGHKYMKCPHKFKHQKRSAAKLSNT